MYDGLYDMWDYAKKNAKTTKNMWDSFADDLDASVGIGQWRVSRNMDEQPQKGEHAVVFTFGDGDGDGDFQVFCKRPPKMSVVIDIATGNVAFLGWSARQAEHTKAILVGVQEIDPFVDNASPDYAVEQVIVDRPQSRIQIAMDYAETDDAAQRIIASGALDDAEKKELWSKRCPATA